MLNKLRFVLNLFSGDKEYDMIIMRHDVGIRWPDGKRDMHHIDLVVYGDQDHEGGFSAMAKTVGYPAAIATKMILEGIRYNMLLLNTNMVVVL